METGDDFLRIDDFKLSEFTKVLPVAVFLVGHNKGCASVFFHFLIVCEQRIVDHFGNVLKRLVDNRGDTA